MALNAIERWLFYLKPRVSCHGKEVVWVDLGNCCPNFRQAVQQVCGEKVRVEVIERKSKQFEVLPKLGIVERSFGWMNRYRRSL